MQLGETVIDQRVDVAIGHRVDTAAATAIAAVRAAERNELLAPKARDAIASVAGDDFDLRFVDEFHDVRNTESSVRKTKAPQRAGLFASPRGAGQAAIGSTFTMCRLVGPFSPKFTVPSTSA